MIHAGIDLHQKYSEICAVSDDGEVLERCQIPTTETSLRRWFSDREPMRLVLECSGSSRWAARILRGLGHEVIAVNPRRVRLIAESSMKTDRIDAEILARLSRFGRDLLPSVYERGNAASLLQTRLRARSSLVRSRVALQNSVRGTLRSLGFRIRGTTLGRYVSSYASLDLPRDLRRALDPLIETIVELSARIDALSKELAQDSRHDERCSRLQTVPGVGPMVSLAFVSWIDRPDRFRRSRDVGAYLGLRPRVRRSASMEYRGRITREGNSELRRLLTQAAHCLLRGQKDCALRQWGLAIAERNGKSKAVVAVARKLAALLHHLWIHEEVFQPFPAIDAAS